MVNKNRKKILLLGFILGYIVLANLNLANIAQATTTPTSTTPTYAGPESTIKALLCTPSFPADQNDLYNCINKIYKFAIAASTIVAVLFIVIAGYLYMGSEGNQETVDKAKSMLVSSITALVILFGGYILLRTLNPDIIQLKSIQPPSITGVVPGATNPNNTAVADLQGSGCAFQTDTQKTEAPQLAPQLVLIVKNICFNVIHNYSDTTGHPATISSVVGLGPPPQHATNSYHYKGCAVDFADGGGNGFFSLSTKQGRPTGVAIYQEALKNGISASRIDPGVDATRTDMLHIDLGTTCPVSGVDPNAN